VLKNPRSRAAAARARRLVQRRLDDFADAVPSCDLQLLDPRSAGVRSLEDQISQIRHGTTTSANERDRGGSAFPRGSERAHDVFGLAAGADPNHDVPSSRERSHLALGRAQTDRSAPPQRAVRQPHSLRSHKAKPCSLLGALRQGRWRSGRVRRETLREASGALGGSPPRFSAKRARLREWAGFGQQAGAPPLRPRRLDRRSSGARDGRTCGPRPSHPRA